MPSSKVRSLPCSTNMIPDVHVGLDMNSCKTLTCAPCTAFTGGRIADVAVALAAVLHILPCIDCLKRVHSAVLPAVGQVLIPDM